MTIELIKCKSDLNFEVDFRVNDAIGTIVIKWDLILIGKWIIFVHNNKYFFKSHYMCTMLLRRIVSNIVW